MSAAVFLHEHGYDPSVRFLVVKGVEVREAPSTSPNESKYRASRVVPASLPDFTAKCPECGGTGWRSDRRVCQARCSRCGGTGTVTEILHGTWQGRGPWGGEWWPLLTADLDSYELPSETRFRHFVQDVDLPGEWVEFRQPGQAAISNFPLERRQAIVAATGVRPLPVVDGNNWDTTAAPYPVPCIVAWEHGPRHLWKGRCNMDTIDMTSEEAADLRPGDTVLELTGEVEWLDPPIVGPECTCECHDGYDPPEVEAECDYCDGSGRVPLSLVPGLQEIEL